MSVDHCQKESEQKMKKILLPIPLMLIATLSLWGLGLWTPSSSIYWRRPAQTTLLVTGRILPSFLSKRVTRLALTTHVEGNSPHEIEFAAVTFEKIAEKEIAGSLHRALVRVYASNGEIARAVQHARTSQQLASGEAVLGDLLTLTIKESEAEQLISQIQQAYPDNELSQATLCRSQLESFENEIPESCQRIEWALEAANSGKSEYDDLSQQIEDLPQVAQTKIAEYEGKLMLEEAERSQHYAELEEIDQKKRQASIDAAIEIGVDMLPLPKPGDTAETFVVREGLCLFPIIRWICAALSAEGPITRMLERQKQLDELRELTAKVIGYNDDLIGRYRNMISYWQSDQPLQELNNQRDAIIPKFRDSITDTIWSRKETTGISVSDAISSISF